MAARARSLRLSDEQRARQLANRDAAVVAVASTWQSLDIATYDRGFPGWLRGASATVTNAQAHAVGLSERFLGAYVASETGRAHRPPPLRPGDYAGTTRDGRPVRDVLILADVTTRLALSQGHPPERALDFGLARAVRAVRTEVPDAGRRALADGMTADSRIVGWERVTSGDPCLACLALSDEGLRSTDEGLEIHAGCSCTALPVVGGVPDLVRPTVGSALFDSLDEAEQDALCEGRGGADKADLLRSGAVSLRDCVSVQHHPEWGAEVYETPFAQLKATAAETADDA